MDRKFVLTGSILMVTGIMLGAFGAHGLQAVLKGGVAIANKVTAFETGVRYQIYSGFTFLLIGFSSVKFNFSLKKIYFFWLLGTLLFSFSIYLLVLQPIIGIPASLLGPITPIGGLLLIVGWLLFIKFIAQRRNDKIVSP
jgi:uncharacterized membrane protein YgdD (TMEM256/DUF423 family)